MMREVVDHEHVVDRVSDLLPPLHAGERREAGADLIGAEAECARSGVHADRVLDVVMAGHRQQVLARPATRFTNDEPRALRPEPEVLRDVVGVAGHRVCRDERARRAPRDGHGVGV